MLARTDSLPTGEGWAFALKLHGFRALADTHDGFRVVSRREWDMSDRVPELRGLPEGLTLSGTYKANTCFPDDTFADPAPPKPYGAALSAFNGTDANGTLSLYVQDFGPNDTGSISGGGSLTSRPSGRRSPICRTWSRAWASTTGSRTPSTANCRT